MDTKLPHRTQSFQNCKETDIPGYNDCPSFLFNVSKKSGRRNRLQYAVQDTYGNTKLPVAPPPISSKRNSMVVSNANSIKPKDDDGSSSSDHSKEILSEDEILKKIDELINRRSKLSEKEYNFYKQKVNLNLPKSINNPSTKTSLLHFLNIGNEKIKQVKYLREWMMMDITISNWCPSFLKLIENTDD